MFKKYQLKNGLKVLLVQSKKSPVVSIQMWVKTGSADEGKGLEGISHFIEHLVFKGTAKFKVGEIAARVEGSGGELNAYTSFDQTVFYVTISSEFRATGLDVISQMMGFPSFEEDEIDNEREVVIEEIKRGNDSPHRQASRQLFEAAYRKHPYGIPVIGYEEVIRKVSRKDLVDYFHSRYVPTNMTLVVVGDFDFSDMQSSVKKHFSGFSKRPLKKVKRKPEPEQKSTRLDVRNSEFEESFLYLAWRIPQFAHRDIPALDLLALIIGQGDSSRLNERLRVKDHSVNSIGASTFTPLDKGFFAISSSLNSVQLDAVLKGIREEIVRFLREGPSAEEMRKALINMNSDDYYGIETVDGMARKFGSFEFLFRDYRYYREFMKQINSLTRTDILRVARRYLRPETLTMTLLTRAEMKSGELALKTFVGQWRADLKTLKSGTKIHRRDRLQKIQWFPKTKRKGQGVDRYELPGGGTLICRPNYETPVVSVRTAFLGGLRLESPDTQGATELLARSWTAGAGKFSEIELAHEMESRASSLTAFGGRNSMGLVVSSLTPFWKDMAGLMELSIEEPHFEDRAIGRERQQMMEQLRTRRDNPAQVAILNFMQSMFGKHSYGLDPHGTEESLARLDREHLVTRMRAITQAKNFHVAITGYFDPKEAQAIFTKMAKKMGTKSPPQLALGFKGPTKNQFRFEESKKEQSHVVIGYPGLKFTDQSRYALQVAQSILAGQGGRLFFELRDKASLAYSVAPLRMEGLDTGYFGAYIGCSPEKTERAVEMLRSEFHKISSDLIASDELERAQRYLIGRHAIDQQRNSALSAAMLFDDLYGIGHLESFHFADRIRAISAEDVRTICSNIFSQAEVISVVGPRQPKLEI